MHVLLEENLILAMSFIQRNVLDHLFYFYFFSHGISNRSRKEEQTLFTFYCIYAFSMPVLITFAVFMIDHLEIFATDYLPYFGIQRCYITASNKAEAIYVYTLISLIIVANIIFFFDTARRIWKAQSLTNDENIQQRRGVLRNRYCVLFISLDILSNYS